MAQYLLGSFINFTLYLLSLLRNFFKGLVFLSITRHGLHGIIMVSHPPNGKKALFDCCSSFCSSENWFSIWNILSYLWLLWLQRTASSSSLASSNGTSSEVKLETIRSLIDFDDVPEPPIAPVIPQATQTTVAQTVNPTNSGDNNWASFDVAPEVKVSQGLSNVNPLESMLSQLSVPSSLPDQVSGAQGGQCLAVAIPLSSIVTLLTIQRLFICFTCRAFGGISSYCYCRSSNCEQLRNIPIQFCFISIFWIDNGIAFQ